MNTPATAFVVYSASVGIFRLRAAYDTRAAAEDALRRATAERPMSPVSRQMRIAAIPLRGTVNDGTAWITFRLPGAEGSMPELGALFGDNAAARDEIRGGGQWNCERITFHQTWDEIRGGGQSNCERNDFHEVLEEVGRVGGSCPQAPADEDELTVMTRRAQRAELALAALRGDHDALTEVHVVVCAYDPDACTEDAYAEELGAHLSSAYATAAEADEYLAMLGPEWMRVTIPLFR